MTEITPEQLIQIHEDYQKWVQYRPFDTSFETYITEQGMRMKAQLYDELRARDSNGDAEAGDRPGQTAIDRAVESGEPL